ncbi:MAG: hypothetical protein R2813_00590 [Flavobacteriales bacterium]
MNSSFSKFFLFSLMVISSLGALQCERLDSSVGAVSETNENQYAVEELIEQQIMARSNEKSLVKEEDKAKTAIKFPNIFDVFRSIF